MTALELIRALNSGTRHPVYFLYGEEDFFSRELLRLLTDQIITPDNRDFNFETFEGKTSHPNDWIEAAKTFSFLGGDKLIIVRNLEEASFADVDIQALIDYTKNPAPGACLALTARKADRKRKLYKHLAGLPGAGDCTAPKEGELVMWIKNRAKSLGYTLETDAAQTLLSRIGPKPGILAQELDKVITFGGGNKTLSQSAVAEVVGAIKLESVFDLTDALKEKNADRALHLLRNQLAHGEEPVKVLGMIAWQFRLIWEVKHHQQQRVPRQQIAKAMGQKPFLVDQALRFTGNFTERQLRNGFQSLSEADIELKSTGKAPEGILESLVLKLCAKAE
ncbi:putative DNA polymerase III, delta subunit [Nitrospina gracilis 3/211]|uniref:DNA polymerase III subunit delta n=1 Tax=Nitrospina gracilis (strain 3/211) TaxID=1266370 RepID=M1YIH0_NITG3|nr:DNA polymerase III subunit delta [Nitrospina gracilis]MCF8723234.1 DNA polymerase-3 subunit delta [Nitrospina sp. Nb-3]CCQ90283.1 putative DNA polymerase III, delta subunit [Nitrospina gracilis 3/211]